MMFEDDAVCIHWLSFSKFPKPLEVTLDACVSPPGATVPAVWVISFSPPKSIAVDVAAKEATTTTAEAQEN
ncbi:hypothetical protein PI125_g18652 [Phytophthora idaei]|nr:hypothetical protein PI125_g18652 [Phytophthora idaei]